MAPLKTTQAGAKLADELPAQGCHMDPDAFRALLRKTFESMFPSLTDEDMLCTEDGPPRFVKAIRKAAGAPKMDHYFICHTLINVRKRGLSAAS